MISISELHTYPVKGFKGTQTDSMEIVETGPLNDRRLMIIGEDNNFITQRTHPLMATIDLVLYEDKFSISLAGNSPEFFAINKEQSVLASVWKDEVKVEEWSKKASQLLSNYLKTPCRLVGMSANFQRTLSEKYQANFNSINFPDQFPFLLISQSSLDDLNSRLDVPVPMNRFRPNIVVSGCDPYAEDEWDSIRIGDIVFDLPKNCSRCLVTAVNQTTGQPEKEKGKNPLKALTRYRNTPKGILFGKYMIHQSTGTIKLGQSIEVLKKSPSPLQAI